MKIKFIVLCIFISSYASAQNILPNSSFEQWFDTLGVEMPIGWITSNLFYPNSVTKSSNSHTGSYAVELNDTSIAFVGTMAVVQKNREYHFSGWAKCLSILGGAFVISWRDTLGNATGDSILIPVVFSTSYKEHKDTLFAPDSALSVIVGFTSLPNATVYVDDITLDSLPQSIEETPSLAHSAFSVSPNPCYGKTLISYSETGLKQTRIEIYDLTGNKIKTFFNKGNFSILWDGKDSNDKLLPAGVYFAKLCTPDYEVSRKLILMR